MESIRQGSVDVLSVAEALTGDVVSRLSGQLRAYAEAGIPRVVLNMQHSPLLDGAALETLLDAREEFEKRGGTLKLVAPTDLCDEILRVTGLDDEFEILTDVRTAVGSFAR
jgi:anti-anti-sigma factor